MKKFLVLSLFIAYAAMVAMACIPQPRPHYYVYSIFPRQHMQNSVGTDNMLKFWKDYTGKQDIEWEVNSLLWVDENDLGASSNEIIKRMLMKKDTEMKEYLIQLIRYLKICNIVAQEGWEYPSKSELREQAGKLNAIYHVAASYKGSRLKQQYALLTMRANMLLNKNQENIELWNSQNSKLSESCYKQMMKGIYAHALLDKGNKAQAISIYAELNDMRSLKWLVKDKRNLQGIKQVYAENPNSPTLPFLVQDFVNNAQESLDNANEGILNNVSTLTYKNEIARFIQFAGDVAKSGKSKSPCMWQTAAGFLNHMLGNHQQAVAQLDAAQKMAGTGRMKDNARACRLIASVASLRDGDKKYYNYLLGEMKWLKKMMDSKENDTHYSEVLERLVLDELAPKFKQIGNINMATLLKSWYAGSSKSQWTFIELTAQQTIQFANYCSSKPSSEFEKWLLKSVKDFLSQETLNDDIGTKYMREGKFAQAIPYLEKVTPAYISQLGISRYMARRSYKIERWFKRQIVDYEDERINPGYVATVKRNQKLDFCKDVLALQEQINNNSGEQQNDALYRLASLYYQASYKGDCWYLTRYTQSAYNSIEYANEFPFIDRALDMLQEAGTTADFRLKEKCLYAIAFIPQGDGWFSIKWDENYNAYMVLNKTSPAYSAMADLNNFYFNNKTRVSDFISRCDVLYDFRMATSQSRGYKTSKHKASNKHVGTRRKAVASQKSTPMSSPNPKRKGTRKREN